MKIQGRLTLGIGVLFAMILLLGIQSVSYVRQLSRATGTILADNYNSLQYAGDMLRSLNDIGADSVSRHALRQSLALQQQNITEVSEKELTAALQQHVASLSDPVTEAEIRTVRQDLFRIMELNMAAIRAKSAGVEQRADYAANRTGNRLVRADGGAEFRPLDRLADPHCKRVCHAGNANHECYQGDLQRFRLNVRERNRAHAGQGNRQHRQHTQHGVIQLRFGAENDADHRHQADGHNDRQNHFRADKQRQRN